jgi:hypothetical protein
MLDVLFTLEGVTDVIELLKIDQAFQSISLGEAINESGTMFEYSANEIAGHPDVEDAIRTIGQNINVSTCHPEILQDVDGRDKPGHDELREFS